MIDIKSIYNKAKINRSSDNVQRYQEAVDELFKNPSDYVSSLEYIITSSYGLKSFESFINENTIPVYYLDNIFEMLNENHNMVFKNKSKPSPYETILEKFESIMNKSIYGKMLCERYQEFHDNEYLKEYYNTYGNKNINDFYSRYGNFALADIIQMECVNSDSNSFLESISTDIDSENAQAIYYGLFDEGVLNTYREKLGIEKITNIVDTIYESTYSFKIDQIRLNEERALQESLVKMESSFNEDLELYKYTEADLSVYESYISWKQDELITNPNIYSEVLSITEKANIINEFLEFNIFKKKPSKAIPNDTLSADNKPSIIKKHINDLPEYLKNEILSIQSLIKNEILANEYIVKYNKYHENFNYITDGVGFIYIPINSKNDSDITIELVAISGVDYSDDDSIDGEKYNNDIEKITNLVINKMKTVIPPKYTLEINDRDLVKIFYLKANSTVSSEIIKHFKIDTEFIESYTSDKKTGKVPEYLSKHHNMTYGEDETKPNLNSDLPGVEENDDASTYLLNDNSSDNSYSDDSFNSSIDNKPIPQSSSSSIPGSTVYNYNYYHSFNKQGSDNLLYNKDHSNKSTNTNIKNTDPNDDKIKTESSDDLFTLDIFQEGILDNMKKFADKAVNKVKSLSKKKTLANLQTMDLINSRPNKSIPSIIGTSIPITESSYNNTIDNEIEDEEDTIFSESSEIQGLTKSDIATVLKKMKDKYQHPILFVNNTSSLRRLVSGGDGGVVVISKDKLDSVISKSDDMVHKLLPESFDKVILLNMSFLNKFPNIKTIEDLEVILDHEYGHCMTFDQLTETDWIEYSQKISILRDLELILDATHIDDLALSNASYQHLKPEKLANDFTKIDFRNVVKASVGVAPHPNWVYTPYHKVIGLKIPPDIIQNKKKCMNGESLSEDDILKSISYTDRIYREILPRDKYLVERKKLQLIRNKFSQKSHVTESVDNETPSKPKSDNPLRDKLLDIDRATVRGQQAAKRKVQTVVNVGKAVAKPFERTAQWMGTIINEWKDKDENAIKEKMADPHSRSRLMSAVKKAIAIGSLHKAGLLLNPIFVFLAITKRSGKNRKEFRLRNEMIGELKTEMEVLDEKIKDADHKGDTKNKYQMMRLKNEIHKKLLRVSGPEISKII